MSETQFKPIAFYPPNSTCDDQPPPNQVIAQNPDQEEYLRIRGWISENTFWAPRRKREEAEAKAAQQAAEAACIVEEKKTAEQAKREKPAAVERERKAIAEAEDKAKRDALHAQQEYVGGLAQSRLQPLRQRLSSINDQISSIKSALRTDDVEGVLQKFLALRAEQTSIGQKMETIHADCAREMEALK